MKQYIIRRVLLTIPLLVAISFVCFALISLIPSDPAEVALRVRQIPVISDEMIAETRAELGLDKPYLIRYLTWVWNVLHGDFGFSYVNPLRSVSDELLRCLPATLELAGASLVLVIHADRQGCTPLCLYDDGDARVLDRTSPHVVGRYRNEPPANEWEQGL